MRVHVESDSLSQDFSWNRNTVVVSVAFGFLLCSVDDVLAVRNVSSDNHSDVGIDVEDDSVGVFLEQSGRKQFLACQNHAVLALDPNNRTGSLVLKLL